MFNLNIFKKPSGPESPEPQPNRCHFQHQNGRRCRLPVADESTQFCGTHRDMLAQAKTKEEQAAESAAITAEIYGPVESLDSAVAINHVLGNLFRLTLEGRIPQRKAALLTSMCRTLLKCIESARNEVTAAKLFPHNHGALLDLVALLNKENAESETVAPQSSLHRDREGGRTCAAAFSASTSPSDPELRLSIVHGPGAPDAEAASGLEAAFPEKICSAERSPELQTASQPAPNPSPNSPPVDNVIWIGHNLLNPNRSSSAFFRQPPIVQADPLPNSPDARGDKKSNSSDSKVGNDVVPEAAGGYGSSMSRT